MVLHNDQRNMSGAAQLTKQPNRSFVDRIGHVLSPRSIQTAFRIYTHSRSTLVVNQTEDKFIDANADFVFKQA